MPFEQLLSKVIKRRKPEREKSDGKGIDGKGEQRCAHKIMQIYIV